MGGDRVHVPKTDTTRRIPGSDRPAGVSVHGGGTEYLKYQTGKGNELPALLFDERGNREFGTSEITKVRFGTGWAPGKRGVGGFLSDLLTQGLGGLSLPED